MEFKGTKSPWVYDHDQEGVYSKNGHIIADIFPGDQEANGLLISKAPEMLKMLNIVLNDYKNIVSSSPARDSRISQIQELIKSATEL